ncbi:hypothetical protein JDV02_006585 [Purpureocillium takamizusanense]|uniref:Secreted protein n=1 Tax=Purpureocillium takamizusanense TaxID=2060973 RepID=A0A9Q8QKI9_9HYPO|nr:uncharacterized protein JDV02_006585 [Purpureocillium takamizusanense]UNI20506.1 hypothetical protein JDV02_006585 [Purpureocillium takamizusanense]
MAASALATSLLTVCPVVGDLPTLFGPDSTTTHPTPSRRQMAALLRNGGGGGGGVGGAVYPRRQHSDSSTSSNSSGCQRGSSATSGGGTNSRRESVDSTTITTAGAGSSCCGSPSCLECDATAAVREMAVCVEDPAEDHDAASSSSSSSSSVTSVLLLTRGSALSGTGVDALGDGFMVFDTSMRQIQTRTGSTLPWRPICFVCASLTPTWP